MKDKTKKLVLLVVDGLGISTSRQNNAVSLGSIENLDILWNKYPHSCLLSPVKTESTDKAKIFEALDGYQQISFGRSLKSESLVPSLLHDDQLLNILNKTREKNSAVHLIFVLSKDDLQSSLNHLIDTIKVSQRNQIFFLYIHLVIDNSFVDTDDLLAHLKVVEDTIESLGLGIIASIVGEGYLGTFAGSKESLKGYFDRSTTFCISAEQAIKSFKKGALFSLPHFILKDRKIGIISNFDLILFSNHNNTFLSGFISDLSTCEKRPRYVVIGSLTETGIQNVIPICDQPAKLTENLAELEVLTRLILPDQASHLRRFWLGQKDKSELRYYNQQNNSSYSKYFGAELDDFFQSDCSFLIIHFTDLFDGCQKSGFSGCANAGLLVNLLIRDIFEKIVKHKANFYLTSPFGMAENISHSSQMAQFGYPIIPTSSALPFIMIEDVKNLSKSKVNSLLLEIASSKNNLCEVNKNIMNHFRIVGDQ